MKSFLAISAIVLLTWAVAFGQDSMVKETITIALPPPVTINPFPLEMALTASREARVISREPVDLGQVSQVLRAAGAASMKDGPTAVYAVIGSVRGFPAGVYRYEPDRHVLIELGRGDLRSGAARASSDRRLTERSPVVFIVTVEQSSGKGTAMSQQGRILSGGRVIQNMVLQASAVGLTHRVDLEFDESRARSFLGLTGESPVALVCIGRR